MLPVLDRNLFFIKEHIGLLKAANNFDILDPATGEIILHCREEIGLLTKLFRFTDYKRMTPFNIKITTPTGELICTVSRGISLVLSKVSVTDDTGALIGQFKQKFFSIGGAFNVLSPTGEVMCTLSGSWASWDFTFKVGTNEIAKVTKKWSGIGKELFTTADNYVLSISDSVPPGHPSRVLVLAAVMCIDLVLKE